MVKAIEDVLSVDIPNLVSPAGKQGEALLACGQPACVPTYLPQSRSVCDLEMYRNKFRLRTWGPHLAANQDARPAVSCCGGVSCCIACAAPTPYTGSLYLLLTGLALAGCC